MRKYVLFGTIILVLAIVAGLGVLNPKQEASWIWQEKCPIPAGLDEYSTGCWSAKVTKSQTLYYMLNSKSPDLFEPERTLAVGQNVYYLGINTPYLRVAVQLVDQYGGVYYSNQWVKIDDFPPAPKNPLGPE